MAGLGGGKPNTKGDGKGGKQDGGKGGWQQQQHPKAKKDFFSNKDFLIGVWG